MAANPGGGAVSSADNHDHLKQIKIPKLGTSNAPSSFRAFHYSLVSYLKAHHLVDVFQTDYDDQPTIATGSSQAEVDKWNNDDTYIHQILISSLRTQEFQRESRAH